ncbi:unnamed protein product [Prorocentrum cordatum]|uniref:Uncharacterized protein n=1 Tax=Prorocentrum cordatum TaxID=2364126 RepID=A0ABN9QZ56_9DINO|nr:unnamed protein product [Polarella glacialis]
MAVHVLMAVLRFSTEPPKKLEQALDQPCTWSPVQCTWGFRKQASFLEAADEMLGQLEEDWFLDRRICIGVKGRKLRRRRRRPLCKPRVRLLT